MYPNMTKKDMDDVAKAFIKVEDNIEQIINNK